MLRSFALLFFAGACFGQTNPAFREIQDVHGLPRVLLIGDSISIGYTEPVRLELTSKANLHRIPENGADTLTGVKNLDKWLGTSKWDVIHFNFGLHDLKIMDDGKHQVPLPDYETNLRTIVQRLKKTGARLIWATTTPVPDAEVKPPRRSADVISYNAAAARIMTESGIPIDDLYALVHPRLQELQLPANVHYTLPGYNVLAHQVAESILRQQSRDSNGAVNGAVLNGAVFNGAVLPGTARDSH
jgi:lysophospholipase L1-like esterase